MDKPDVKIRTAKLSDFEKIKELNQLLFHSDFKFDKTLKLDWPKSEIGINYYKERLKSDDSCVFVAAIYDEIVGYLIGNVAESASYRKLDKFGELENMFVLEKYRNLKIGSKLVAMFIDWCKIKNIKRIRTEASAANKKAIDFYKKNGFEEYNLVLEGNI